MGEIKVHVDDFIKGVPNPQKLADTIRKYQQAVQGL